MVDAGPEPTYEKKMIVSPSPYYGYGSTREDKLKVSTVCMDLSNLYHTTCRESTFNMKYMKWPNTGHMIKRILQLVRFSLSYDQYFGLVKMIIILMEGVKLKYDQKMPQQGGGGGTLIFLYT